MGRQLSHAVSSLQKLFLEYTLETIIARRTTHLREIRSRLSNVFELSTFAKELEADGKSEYAPFVYDMTIDLFNYHPNA